MHQILWELISLVHSLGTKCSLNNYPNLGAQNSTIGQWSCPNCLVSIYEYVDNYGDHLIKQVNE